MDTIRSVTLAVAVWLLACEVVHAQQSEHPDTPTYESEAKASSAAVESVWCEQCGSPPAPKPWKTLFFDNDFSDKNNPSHAYLLGEELKDMPLDFLDRLDILDGSTLSFGGEIRHRNLTEVPQKCDKMKFFEIHFV